MGENAAEKAITLFDQSSEWIHTVDDHRQAQHTI